MTSKRRREGKVFAIGRHFSPFLYEPLPGGALSPGCGSMHQNAFPVMCRFASKTVTLSCIMSFCQQKRDHFPVLCRPACRIVAIVLYCAVLRAGSWPFSCIVPSCVQDRGHFPVLCSPACRIVAIFLYCAVLRAGSWPLSCIVQSC